MITDITFTSSISGKKLSGRLYFHEGAPILLMCYGFPGDHRNVDIAEKVYASGISVFQLNYRGIEESEGDFTFEGAIQDVQAAVDYLYSLNVDKKKIGLLGHCYSAIYTTYVAANDPRVSALVLLGPLVDLDGLIRDYNNMQPDGFNKFMEESKHGAREGFYGARGDPEYWKKEHKVLKEKYEPDKWIGKLKISVLILQGSNDVDTPLYHSDELMEAGKFLNPPLKRIIYEGADHYFKGAREKMISDLISFLKETWSK